MTVYIYILMTFDTAPRGECILVSYDVSGGARSVAARVCQIVFGRKRIVHGRARDEHGFIHRRGVAWIGQSVLVMSSRDAEELATRLRSLGVRVAMARSRSPVRVWRRSGGRVPSMLDDAEWERLSTLYNGWIDDVADVLQGLATAAQDAERSVEGPPIARAVVADLRTRIEAAIGELIDRTITLTVEMAKFQA